MKYIYSTLIGISLVLLLTQCSSSNDSGTTGTESEETSSTETESTSDVNKGIGPISSVTLGEVSQEMAAEGEETFTTYCSACHKMDKRFIGPALQGITDRRSPEWIMNMILNPEQMVAEDPDAKALLAEYLSPMANQNLTEEQARAILEYFRTQTL